MGYPDHPPPPSWGLFIILVTCLKGKKSLRRISVEEEGKELALFLLFGCKITFLSGKVTSVFFGG